MDKIFRVTIKKPLLNGEAGAIAAEERLIKAGNMQAVTDYLLEIKKADAEDVATLMANGVKVEGVGQ